MAEGFNYDNLIKIGFLNENETQLQEQYKNNFDIIILSNGPMNAINNLLAEII